MSFDVSKFFKASNDPIWVLGSDGRIKGANNAFERYVGQQGLEGRHYLEFIHPSDRVIVDHIVSKILLGEAPPQFRAHLIGPNASLITGFQCIVNEGEMFAISRDSSYSMDTVFSDIFDQVSLGFAISDPHGHLQTVNGEFARSNDADPDFMRGTFLGDYVPVVDLQNALARLVVGTQSKIWIEFQRDDKWYGATTTLLRFPDGTARGFVTSQKDITERKHIEEQLKETIATLNQARETSRIKSEFLANMSHEIRTPLNGIVCMTSVLRETKMDERQAECAETIDVSSRALLAIINDILDLSKIEAGKLTIESVSFELRELVEDIEKVLRPVAEAKGISLVRSIPPALLDSSVVGDFIRVRQVLFNLVQNAVKFTEHGVVELVIGQRDRDVTFEVRDTGIGIPASAHKAIFEAFEQADSSTTRRHGGTGLGLSICRKLVRAMGGEIGLASQPGKGSTFRFSLLLNPTRSQRFAGISVPVVPKGSLKGLNILVAEDHEINRRVMKRMLEGEGCAVEFARNGEEAIALVHAKKFDLVLMDCHMPQMDGYEATARIRSFEPHLPIVALTADALQGTREKCLAARMNGYLTKPLDIDELRRIASGVRVKRRPRVSSRLILNRSALEKIDRLNENGKSDLTAELIGEFVAGTPSRLASIVTALDVSDLSRVREEAHALKSVANLLGAEKLGAVCRDLEMKSSVRSAHEIRAKFSVLETAFNEAKTQLEKELRRRA